MPHKDVRLDLRERLETLKELGERLSGSFYERSQADGGEQSVSGGRTQQVYQMP
jgi:hypothetical protein